MKIILASVGASLLIACGGESGADATVYVDPPTNGDNSCVGVAGFEVIVSPTGQAQQTKKLVGPATILDATACAVPSFSIPNLEIDAAIIVTVNGYDGSGTKVRVTGRQTIQSLRQGPVHLQLEPASSQLPPLLVFDRGPLLGSVDVSQIETIGISPQMGGGMSLLNVNRTSAGVFMDLEPGAYGISTGLTDGLAINVNFTAQGGQMIRDAKLTVGWNGRYFTTR